MGTYYAVAGLYDSCPESSEWYSEAAKDKAVAEAVRRHNDNGGPMSVIKITTEHVGVTKVAYKDIVQKETDEF